MFCFLKNVLYICTLKQIFMKKTTNIGTTTNKKKVVRVTEKEFDYFFKPGETIPDYFFEAKNVTVFDDNILIQFLGKFKKKVRFAYYTNGHYNYFLQLFW